MSKTYFVTRPVCPGCGSDHRRTLYSCGYLQPPIYDYLKSYYTRPGGIEFEYLQGASYTLDQCQNCSLVYQEQIPNHFLLKKLYEEWIDPHKPLAHHTKGLAFSRHYLQEVMMFINFLDRPPQDLKVLDFGMGWGHWSLAARAFGCQVWGHELSEAQIQYGRSQGINMLTWEEIPQHHFDFINCEQVFEHLTEPQNVLQHLRRGLAPGGLIKIATPDGTEIPVRLKHPDWSADKYSRNSLNPVSPLEHLNSFNRRSILMMTRLLDLEEVRLPLAVHYASLVHWKPFAAMLRNAVIPLYRKLHPRRTWYLFRPLPLL
jgi:2-polyprenyl-3-methyl-5-hydroxy-6-metoxy-1,4-benzoquinol methylase